LTSTPLGNFKEKSRVADPDPYPDADPGGNKIPKKIEKSTEFSCFEVLDVLF
jgi:hypothetical protein